MLSIAGARNEPGFQVSMMTETVGMVRSTMTIGALNRSGNDHISGANDSFPGPAHPHLYDWRLDCRDCIRIPDRRGVYFLAGPGRRGSRHHCPDSGSTTEDRNAPRRDPVVWIHRGKP